MNECNYPTDVLERFWSKIAVNPNKEECWFWLRRTCKDGYGLFDVATDWKVRAHRFAYQCYHGPIIEGNVILHECDTPSCCNPYHLSQGTVLENMKDRSNKNRTAKGSRNGTAKLNETNVEVIKRQIKDKIDPIKIAGEFNVSRTTIYRIRQDLSWKHVTI